MAFDRAWSAPERQAVVAARERRLRHGDRIATRVRDSYCPSGTRNVKGGGVMLHPTPPRFHAIVLPLAVVTAIASTWPVAAHLLDHVIDGARLINAQDPENFAAANIGADVLTTVWIVNWVLHALATQPLHL